MEATARGGGEFEGLERAFGGDGGELKGVDGQAHPGGARSLWGVTAMGYTGGRYGKRE